MLQPLRIPGSYFWSEWQDHIGLPGNSFLFTSKSGNAVIDPLPVDERTLQQIEQLGGVAKIIVTPAAYQRDAQALSERFGAPVTTNVAHDEEIFPGMFAIKLNDQEHPGAFAVNIPELRVVLAGSCVLGTPAGALSMFPESAYADVTKAALGLRRILRAYPQALLVGQGQSLFTGAYEAMYQLLYSQAGAYVHRINIDELDFRDGRDEHDEQPQTYQCRDAEVGLAIGARKLGYRVSTLEPGHRFCPLHSHAREEELFFVLEGTPSVRTLKQTVQCRPGDFIALPVGETGTHQLINEGDAPATIILLARNEFPEVCYYPDSDKLLVDLEEPLINGRSSMMVHAGPDLDYFDGEPNL
ncbi:MAG TPA: cupin domain-containing protein [Candidatus Baltobacteraceae bacterium]|nr:cupin domain-containing protein [Candidatus Baltobacteraceae bacterium]